MQVIAPSSKTTLVILLGASAWPRSPALQGSKAFANAAHHIRAYFRNQDGFNLPKSNLLDLFDKNDSAPDLLSKISQFLQQKTNVKSKSSNVARDVLVYYIGHGGITADTSSFYLAICRTEKDYEKGTSITMEDLAERLKGDARFQRRILILDCCFAAAAVKYYQGATTMGIATSKTFDAFKEPDKNEGFPSRGTSFLCASSKDKVSHILPDKSSTMFTHALLQVLRTGSSSHQGSFSLHTAHRFMLDFLEKQYKGQFTRPEVHSPDQSEGKVEEVPFFPNPAALGRFVPSQGSLMHHRPTFGEKEKERGHPLNPDNTLVRALQIDPSSITTRFRLAETYLETERYEDALALYQSLINRRKDLQADDLGAAYAGLAETYNLMERYDEAMATSRTLLEKFEDEPEGYYQLATAQGALGQYDEAIENYWNAINRNPLAEYYNDLADTLRIVRRYDEAIEVAQQAITQDPSLVVAHETLAQIYEENGESDQAATVWEQAIDRQPTSPLEALPPEPPFPKSSLDHAPAGTTLFTYRGHTDIVWNVKWSPDGSRIASASKDGTAQVWHAATGKTLLTYQAHMNPVYDIAWSPDSSRIASGSEDGTVQVWNATTGQRLLTYRNHAVPVYSVGWSPDGSRIASTSKNGPVKVWDAATGQRLLTHSTDDPFGFADFADTEMIAWSPNGEYIASVKAESSIRVLRVWDATTGDHIFSREIERGNVAWSPDSKHIVSADYPCPVWDITTNKTVLSFGGTLAISSVAWSPNGKYIAFCDDRAEIREAATDREPPLLVYYGHASSNAYAILALAWSPDSSRVASASAHEVQVWQAVE